MEVSGVVGNALSEDLSFTISQPGRPSENQYPSIITPLAGAEALFEYSPGVVGVTQWAGSNKVVNSGFGFEAITDFDTRVTIMGRILEWFNDFSISHTPLADTENITEGRTVTADLASQSAPDSMAIYWSLDGNVPFNINPMTEASGVYSGTIPAQAAGSTVYYFIYAQAANGYLQTSPVGAPLAIHSYSVGPDAVLPEIANVSELPTTIDNSGQYAISADITDNIGVNPAGVYVHFKLNDGANDSTLLALESGSQYSGEINFNQLLFNDDVVSYFISAEDLSASVNRSQSAVASFSIVNNMEIDGFEASLSNWDINQGWEQYFFSHSGSYAITESPVGYYDNNSDYTMEYTTPFNLSTRDEIFLSFWHIYSLGDGDTISVETSLDGQSWETAEYWIGTNNYTWENAVVSLNDFIGETSVSIRYRLVSDAAGSSDGWYIDDIFMYADSTLIVATASGEWLPTEFALKQNYPNPFNPVTTIEYHLPIASDVRITLYNLAGQAVGELVNEDRPAGVHKLSFNAGELASGMYFYRIETAGFDRTRKMLLIK